MPDAGLKVHPDCVSTFNDLKLRKGGITYIIYRISDDDKEIIVDEKGTSTDYEDFFSSITSKKDPKFKGKDRPSYAVYDINFELGEGEGKRSKVTFITYNNDDNTAIKSRMVYASSRETLKNALSGIALQIQANEPDDLEYETILKTARRGKA